VLSSYKRKESLKKKEMAYNGVNANDFMRFLPQNGRKMPICLAEFRIFTNFEAN